MSFDDRGEVKNLNAHANFDREASMLSDRRSDLPTHQNLLG